MSILKTENLVKIYGQETNMVKALDILEQMSQNGIDIKRLTLDLVDILKDVIIYKNTKSYDILFVLSSYDIEKIVPYISSEEAFEFIDILMDASEKYSKVVNPAIYFELAVLKICNHVKEVKAPQKIEVVEHQESIIKNSNNQHIMEEEIINDTSEEIAIVDEPIIEEEIPTFEFEKHEEVKEIDNDIKVSIDDIMNILVQARREILQDIQEKWPVIKRYLANLNTAKSASMLCDGSPVAACKGGLIISFEYMPSVNAVNYYKNYKQLSLFIKELLGEEYKFIAVEQEYWLKLRSKFIELQKKNQLPMPHEITLKHIDNYDLDRIELNEAQQFAVDLFGDIVEFKEEE